MFLQGMAGCHLRWYERRARDWNGECAYRLWSDRFRMEQAYPWQLWSHGAPLRFLSSSFLLEHQARRKIERQSVGSDVRSMDCASPPAARNFINHHASCITAAVTNDSLAALTHYTMQN